MHKCIYNYILNCVGYTGYLIPRAVLNVDACEEKNMNKDSLKIINEFILQNKCGILLSGPSCIGKTSFSRFLKQHDDFVGGIDFPKLPMRWVMASETVSDIQRIAVEKCMKQLTKFELGRCARHDQGKESLEHLNARMKKHKDKVIRMRKTHDITEGKGIIILGVPWYVWKERNGLRDRWPDWSRRTSTDFKEKYAGYIKKLEEFNIPYICVDNRNDFPILDKSSFLTMLTEDV